MRLDLVPWQVVILLHQSQRLLNDGRGIQIDQYAGQLAVHRIVCIWEMGIEAFHDLGRLANRRFTETNKNQGVGPQQVAPLRGRQFAEI